MKAIIVDDEQSARLTLKSILNEYFKEIVVIGEAESPGAAVTLIEEKKPDIVFLDIQMQTGSGFDVLESLDNRNFQTIFISAHKQHAFDSFRFNAADYILKPVRIKDLRDAIDKVKENLKNSSSPEEHPNLRHISQDQSRIQLVLPEIDGFSVVKLSEIIRCESLRNYTEITLVGLKKLIATKNLGEFDDLLIPHGFIRIHKSHIINLYHLSRYIKGRGGDVIMSDGGDPLPVSRDRKDPLMEAFLK